MRHATDDLSPRRIEYFYSGPVTRMGVTLPGFQAEGCHVAMTAEEAADDAHDLGAVAMLIDGYDCEIR